MKKSQADILTITLIVVISIALVGAAYLWMRPLLQKRQDTLTVEKLLSDFDQRNQDSLPRKIEYVALTGGRVSFTASGDGIWRLSPEENSIEFSTFSKVSNIAVGKGWISYTPGGNCSEPSLPGKIGEPASVVCIKVDVAADGYILTYRATFRELEESPQRKHKIELESLDKREGSERMLVLQFDGTKERKADTEVRVVVTKVLVLLS